LRHFVNVHFNVILVPAIISQIAKLVKQKTAKYRLLNEKKMQTTVNENKRKIKMKSLLSFD
jgi:hypothetical protein